MDSIKSATKAFDAGKYISTKKPTNGKPMPGMPKVRPHITRIKTASGLKVEFNEGNFGEAPFYLVKQEGKTIVITYNRDHPFWRELVVYADETRPLLQGSRITAYELKQNGIPVTVICDNMAAAVMRPPHTPT